MKMHWSFTRDTLRCLPPIAFLLFSPVSLAQIDAPLTQDTYTQTNVYDDFTYGEVVLIFSH